MGLPEWPVVGFHGGLLTFLLMILHLLTHLPQAEAKICVPKLCLQISHEMPCYEEAEAQTGETTWKTPPSLAKLSQCLTTQMIKSGHSPSHHHLYFPGLALGTNYNSHWSPCVDRDRTQKLLLQGLCSKKTYSSQ